MASALATTKTRDAPETRAAGPKRPKPIRHVSLPSYSPSLKLNVTEDAALTYSAVYGAVTILSSGIGIVPLNVRRLRPDGGSDLVPDHLVQFFIHTAPNIEQTAIVWKECLTGALALWGNFYAWIERDGAAGIVGLWPCHPSCTQAKRDEKTNALFYEVSGADGKVVQVLPVQMIHVPLFGDGIVGRSPLSLARQSIGIGIAMDRHAGGLFGNWGVPSGVLEHPGEIGEEGVALLRDSWHVQVGGNNAGGIAILEEGMKFHPIGMPNDDAQFLESRRFQVQDVARVWRIPPHMLGDLADGVRANVEEQNRTFLQNTLMPYIKRIEQELTRKLLPRNGGMVVKANTQAFLQGDTAARGALYKTMRELGVYSVNDILELEDRNPIGEEGDVRIVPLNFQSLEALLNPPQPQPEPMPEEPSPIMAKAVRAIYRDVVGRIVHKESSRLLAIGKKHKATTDEWSKALASMYRGLESDCRLALSVMSELGRNAAMIEADSMAMVKWLRMNVTANDGDDEGARVSHLLRELGHEK